MRKFIFSLTLFFNGYNIRKAKIRLSRFEGESIEQLKIRRDVIVGYHLQSNPLYRNLNDVNGYTKFQDLPILKKQDFQRPLSEIISDKCKVENLYVANTSGSSGHPFFFAKNKDSHANTHYVAKELYASCGITANDKQARFYGIPARGISRFKEKLKDVLCNRVRFPVFDLSDQQLEVYLNRFRKTNFGYVYGYTSAILIFAKYLIRNGIILKNECPSLKCCIVTSEMCLPEDKAIIEKAFNMQVINEYGCSETGIIAFHNGEGVWEMTTHDCYYEVVDDDGAVLPYGEEGRLLITSLSNYAMPFIRYEVGDRGRIEPYKNGFQLTKLSGRVNDIVKLPSGKISAGLTFYYISRSILEKNNNIKEFIIRQTSIDTFVFDLITNEPLSDNDVLFLQEQMDLYLEPGLNVKINRVNNIIRPASGKIKHFYSEIN